MSEDNKELTVEHFYSAINPKAVLGVLDLLHDIRNLIDLYLTDMQELIIEVTGAEEAENVTKLHIPGKDE